MANQFDGEEVEFAVAAIFDDGLWKVTTVNKNRVSTKSHLSAYSALRAKCAQSKCLHFLREKACCLKNSVKPNKNGTKK